MYGYVDYESIDNKLESRSIKTPMRGKIVRGIVIYDVGGDMDLAQHLEVVYKYNKIISDSWEQVKHMFEWENL